MVLREAKKMIYNSCPFPFYLSGRVGAFLSKNNQMAYITLLTNKLQFYEGHKHYWNVFPKEPTQGIVGCFVGCRGRDWDLFVVVDYDEENKIISAVFPRLRINSSGELSLGKDKTTETVKVFKCTHSSSYQKYGFCQYCDQYCSCGAYYDRTNLVYGKLFEKVGIDYRYNIINVKVPTCGIYLGFVKKEIINDLNIPLSGTCCKSSQYSSDEQLGRFETVNISHPFDPLCSLEPKIAKNRGNAPGISIFNKASVFRFKDHRSFHCLDRPDQNCRRSS